jgi:hypothetical protein
MSEWTFLRVGNVVGSVIIDWSTFWIGIEVVSGIIKNGPFCRVIRIQPLPALGFVFGFVKSDDYEDVLGV